MELRNLKTFIRTAELRNFTRAAESLGYAQSTVTAQVEALEKELGMPLFIRNGKRVVLSSAGEELLSYAYRFRALEEETRLHFDRNGKPAGHLTVGIVESVSVSEYVKGVASYLRKYPEVDLKVTVDTTIRLMEALKKGEIDAAVLLDRPVADGELHTFYRKPEKICFFACGASKYGRSVSVSLKDLEKEPWLLTEKGCNYRKELEEEFASRGIFIESRLEMGSTRALIDFVAGGLGISLLPEFDLKEELLKGRIVRIPVSDYEMEMELQILVSRKRWMRPALMCFCEEMAMEEKREYVKDDKNQCDASAGRSKNKV